MEVNKIRLNIDGRAIVLSNNSILNIEAIRASNYFLIFNNSKIKDEVCCINTPVFDEGIYTINGQRLLNLKYENKHNLVIGIMSFIFSNLNHYKYFIIDSSGMDLKEVEDLKDFVLLLSRQRIKIYFLIFKLKNNNFKLSF
jgi:hypothetical protein